MIYSTTYYALTSITGYMLVKDTSMMPTWLGGRGSCMNGYIYLPTFTEDTFWMKVYLLVTFGKNLNKLVVHTFIRPDGNFYEYLLHHSLASLLILFCYLTNYWLMGTFTILIHDLSDMAVSASRFYSVRSLQFRTIDTT